jgi:hypothetical protein
MNRLLPTLKRVGPLLLLLILAAALRFYALDRSSLWSDEGNTWALIQRSYAQIAVDAAADIHPPGYYWLLKSWSLVFGTGAAAMRGLSALLGVALVAVVYRLGRRLDPPHRFTAWSAAWLVALNPFHLYYSQEARMYMLLALAGAGLFWALLAWFADDQAHDATGRRPTGPLPGFIVAGVVGCWTHYSFPILLSAAGLAYLLHWLRLPGRPLAPLLRYIGANLLVVLLFLPWLPTAVARVLAWPKGGMVIPAQEGLALALQTGLFGPLRTLPAPLWPWLLIGALLPLLGIWALRRTPAGWAVTLWWLAPLGLMFGLGLWSDAFLKFLLAGVPAWALLCAAAPRLLPRPAPVYGTAAVMVAGAYLAWVALPGYYSDPRVRDNYAGVARYIAAVADPTRDLVLLNAPGQAEVWGYYDPGVPVLALPQQRPPDLDATLATLGAAITDRRQIFALYWATDEADPDRIVERRLDQTAFRGLESWQGNLHFVVYTLPTHLICMEIAPPTPFGPAVELLAHCQPDPPQSVPAGEVALVELRWRTQTPLATRYKVTLQLLDARNQVIAQHDAEPAGGSRPTDSWTPGEVVGDNHGLPIPFGTPPGDYRLIVALYDGATGARLATPTGDAFELGTVGVTRPQQHLPLDILPIAHRLDIQAGPVRLVGYDLYKQGHSYAPETPLLPGDLIHFTLYWQAPDPLPADWPADQEFQLHLGDQVLRAPLAGGNYPTAAWRAGELVRGEFDLPFDGVAAAPWLELDDTQIPLPRLPQAQPAN